MEVNPLGPMVAGPDVLDRHIAILGDLERNTVLPDEPEHLFLVAQHRIEMAAVVEELPFALTDVPSELEVSTTLISNFAKFRMADPGSHIASSATTYG